MVTEDTLMMFMMPSKLNKLGLTLSILVFGYRACPYGVTHVGERDAISMLFNFLKCNKMNGRNKDKMDKYKVYHYLVIWSPS